MAEQVSHHRQVQISVPSTMLSGKQLEIQGDYMKVSQQSNIINLFASLQSIQWLKMIAVAQNIWVLWY